MGKVNSVVLGSVMLRRGCPRYPGRSTLPVSGPAHFRADVEAVLSEARQFAPGAYRDALEYLPKASYEPENPRFKGNTYVAYSSGIFRWDATEYWNGVLGFRRTFWHEVGHNVDADVSAEGCEARADAYADDVVTQIEDAQRQKITSQSARWLLVTPVILPVIPLVQRVFPGLPVMNAAQWQAVGASVSLT